MSTSTSHYELDGPLTLFAPGRIPFPVHAVDLALERDDGVLFEVRLTFQVPPAAYLRIADDSLFHLTDAARGPASGDFTADAEVQIEARLDVDLLPDVAAMGDDILETGPAFAALAPGSPLLETERWYALAVTKEVLRDAEGGTLREGFSTVHAGAEDLLTLPILTIAAAAFEERNLEWQDTDDNHVIRTEYTGGNGTWFVFAIARHNDQRCTVYSQVPWTTPEEHRPAMAEAVTRVNFGLPLGNFELDYSDGEVRFKTSIDVTGARLTTQLFEDLFEPNLSTMDLYLPALEAVRDGRMSPEEAVRMVEDS